MGGEQRGHAGQASPSHHHYHLSEQQPCNILQCGQFILFWSNTVSIKPPIQKWNKPPMPINDEQEKSLLHKIFLEIPSPLLLYFTSSSLRSAIILTMGPGSTTWLLTRTLPTWEKTGGRCCEAAKGLSVTDHYQCVNVRLESASGCSFRARGVSPHVLPKLTTPHFQKQTSGLREIVSSEYRSLAVRRLSLHKIPSSFISSLQPLLRSSSHWQCPFCVCLPGSPPSSVSYTDWTWTWSCSVVSDSLWPRGL